MMWAWVTFVYLLPAVVITIQGLSCLEPSIDVRVGADSAVPGFLPDPGDRSCFEHLRFDVMWRGTRDRMAANNFAIPQRLLIGETMAI